MDFSYKGLAWVAGLRQKFESLCLEVDGVIQEETFEYVEHQLQALGGNIETQLTKVGANIKQLCSEFVHDVLPAISLDSVEGAAPELSRQQNQNIDLTHHESSTFGVDIDPMQKLCDQKSVAHPYLKEVVEGKPNDSLCEKINVSVMENAIAEKSFSTEIPDVDDTAEEDSSMASSFCGISKSDADGRGGQVDLSTQISLEGYNSYLKDGETTNGMNATADNPNAMASANSVILIESSKCIASDSGRTSGDVLSAVSNDSCCAGFELCNEVAAESEDYVSVAYSVAEGSDDVSAETSADGYVIEPGMETTQFSELKLDESCLMVDTNKICSLCLSAAKNKSCKMKTCEACTMKMKQECGLQANGNEDLDTGLNQQQGECLVSSVLTRNVDPANHDFCDSDWEII